jgi:prevent-host-death family protein
MPRTIAEKGQMEDVWDLARAAHDGEDIIIESNGERLAAIIGIAEYDERRIRTRDEFFELVERVQARNQDVDPDEADAFILKVCQEVRAARGKS